MIGKLTKPTFTTPADVPEWMRLLLAAGTGWGKTRLLGTIGKGNKAIIIDSEEGTVTFRHPDFRNHEDATEIENLHIISLAAWDVDPTDPNVDRTKLKTLADLKATVEGAFDYVIRSKNEDGYTLVAIDSLSELQTKFLRYHQANDPRQSYGEWANWLGALSDKAKHVPAHVVFTARLRASTDEVLGREVVHSELAPSARGSVEGKLHTIAYGEMKILGPKTVRQLNMHHTVRTAGKDRMGFDATYQEPTFRQLAEAVKQAREGTPTPVGAKPGAKFIPARS